MGAVLEPEEPDESFLPDHDKNWRGESAVGEIALAEEQLPKWFSEKRFAEPDVAARLYAALRQTAIPLGSVTNQANEWATRLSMPSARINEGELLNFLRDVKGLSPRTRFCVAEAIGIDPSDLIEHDQEYFRPPPVEALRLALHQPRKLGKVEWFVGGVTAIIACDSFARAAQTLCGSSSTLLLVASCAFAAVAGAAVAAIMGRWVNYFMWTRRLEV